MGSRRTEEEIRKLERRYERLVEEEEALGRLISDLSDLAWIRPAPVSDPAVTVLIHWAQRVAEALDNNQAAQTAIGHLRRRLKHARPKLYRRTALDRKVWCRLVADCEQSAAGIDLNALEWQHVALRAEKRRLHKKLVNLRRSQSADVARDQH